MRVERRLPASCLIGRLDTDAPDTRAPHRYERVVIETFNQESNKLAISPLTWRRPFDSLWCSCNGNIYDTATPARGIRAATNVL
jgi:hypothetical protein